MLSIWVMTGVLGYRAVEPLISGDCGLREDHADNCGYAVAMNLIMGLTPQQRGHRHSPHQPAAGEPVSELPLST